MNELQKLYDVLISEGLYTKSFDAFKEQYQDQSYRDKVYNVVSDQGLYTKSKNEFDLKYKIDSTPSPDETEVVSSGVPEKKNPFESEPDLQEEPKVPEELALPSESDTQSISSESFLTEDSVDETDPFAGSILSDQFNKDLADNSFMASVNSITPELTGDREEEQVVPEMNYKFNQYGFTFEETGIGDKMKVKAANGEEISIPLDAFGLPFTDKLEVGAESRANKLRDFLIKNKKESEKSFTEATLKEQKKLNKIQNKEELVALNTLFNTQVDKFSEDVKNFSAEKLRLGKIYKNTFAGKTAEELEANPYYKEYVEATNNLNSARTKLVNRQKNFATKGAQLDEMVGEYTLMQSQQGGAGQFVERLGNSLLEGVGGAFLSGAEEIAAFLAPKLMNFDASESKFAAGEHVDYAVAQVLNNTDGYQLDDITILAGEQSEELQQVKELLAKGKLDVTEDKKLKSLLSDFSPKNLQVVLENIKTPDGNTLHSLTESIFEDVSTKAVREFEETEIQTAVKGRPDLIATEKISRYQKAKSAAMGGAFSENIYTGRTGYLDLEEGLRDKVRTVFNRYIGGEDDAQAAYRKVIKNNGNDVQKAMHGVAYSIPAFVGVVKTGGQKAAQLTAKYGKELGEKYLKNRKNINKASRIIRLMSQSTEAQMNKMANNPNFDSVDLDEQRAVAVPVAITTAVLEDLGFRNIINSGGLVNSLAARAIGKFSRAKVANPKIGSKTFADFIRKDVDKVLSGKTAKAVKFGLTVGAGGAAEFETGALQSIGEIGIEALYNNYKKYFDGVDKKMFDTPESISEFASEVMYQGYLEMLGGKIMAIPTAISAMGSNPQDLNLVTDEAFEMFNGMIKDPQYKKMFVTNLKQRVADPNDKLTQKDAAKMLQTFNKIEGLAPKIPADFTIEQQRTALNLLMEKQQLESAIEGKAPELVVNQTERISKINEELTNITTQAAAEQEAAQEAEQSIPDFGVTDTQVKPDSDIFIQDPSKGYSFTYESEQDIPNKLKGLDPISKSESEVNGKKQIRLTFSGQQLIDAGLASQSKTEGDVTLEEQQDIQQLFGTEETVTEKENLFFNRKGKPEAVLDKEQISIRNKVINKAVNAAKSLAKNFDTKIILHESSDEFNKATDRTGRGFYDFDNKTIHIDMNKANESTIAHEVFHSVLFERLGEKNIAAAVNNLTTSTMKALDKNSLLYKKIDNFAKLYKEEGDSIQNEERLAELFGEMAGRYETLQPPAQNAIIKFVKQVGKALGIDVGDIVNKGDVEVVNFLNTLADKVRTGEVIEETDVTTLEELDNGTNPVGNPTTIVKPTKSREQKINFKNSYPLSLVSSANKINIDALVDEIATKGQKVWFWVADQLGLDAEMDIDAGPSFAFQKEGEIWASSFPLTKLKKNISNADYIFIISGSPSKSHLFNKKVYDKYIQKLGDYNTFKQNALNTNPTKGIRDVLNKYESWEEIKEADGSVRKNFLIALNAQANTPNTEFHKLVKSLDGFIDPNSLRDGFYRENNFQQNDVMLVLKPTGAKEGSNHSTYSNTILGEVIGVPDTKIDAFELMPAEMRESMEGAARTQTSQKVAPYGSGVREVTSRKGREQKEVVDIVNEGREYNFRDEVIKDYLVRVKKYPAKLVNKIMEVEVDLFKTLPKSFANIEGGVEAGLKLYKRVKAFEQKLINSNKRKKVKLTEQQIADQTIEFLQKQPEYKKEGDGTKSLTTKQAMLQVEFQKSVGTRASENMQDKLTEARRMVQQRKRGAKNLQQVKSSIRNFIRKSLPKDIYTRGEVMKLIRKVTTANESNIENIFAEVTDFVNIKNNTRLEKKIENLLNGKYETRVGGKVKAAKISSRIKERIDKIKKDRLSKNSSAKEIDAENEALNKEFNNIAKKPNLQEGDLDRMVDLQILINLNNSLQMENTDVNKTGALDVAFSALEEMIQQGRSELKQELEEAHTKYNDDASVAYEEVTGNKVDMNDPDAKEVLEEEQFKRDNAKTRERVNKRIRTGMKDILKRIEVGVFASAEALDGLMDRISKLPGEMFGGRLQEMVTDKVDESSRNFKSRMLQQEKIIKDKMKEFYGPKWADKARSHNNIESTGIYRNPSAVQQAQDAYNKDKNGVTKAALDKALADNELYLSQNQMYYLYNQYKDPANRKAFENMYGKDYARIMKEMEARLQPEVKAFADWQVNEYFPSLYQHYNKTYKAIYRTNMPWNQFYAGRIYREGVEMEVLDLLSNESVYNTSVGAASTKARVDNALKITPMNGTDALASYLKDMEYFAAYAENIRDINKMFNNKYVRDAITTIHGKTVMSLIDNAIQKIANKGGRTTLADRIVNGMNTAFIIGRIALSPVITIKQLTSMVTYINDIGFVNYTKYAMKNIPDVIKTYKEIRDNSVYMQDRKNQSIFTVIESYSDGAMKSFIPSPTKQFYINFMMFTTKFGDRAAIMLGGMPNYAYYKDQALKNGKTEQEAIDIAIRKFERDTKRTQQSQDLQDKDVFQTSNPVIRGLNMFLTTPKQYLRKEIQGTRNLFRKIRAMDAKAGKGTITENIRTMLMYHVVAPTVFQYVSMGLPGLLRPFRDDDDEDLIRAAVIGNLNALFILGELFQAAGDFFTDKSYAGDNARTVGILQIGFRITLLAKRYENTKDPKKKQEAFEKLIAEILTLSSLPAPTLKRFIDNYVKVGEGSLGEDILRLLNFSNYQIEGPPKKKSSSKTKSIAEQNAQYFKEQERKKRQSKNLGFQRGDKPTQRRRERPTRRRR